MVSWRKTTNSKLIVALFCLAFSGCTFIIQNPAFAPPKSKKPNLFRGVYHVHTQYSHDSKAPLELVMETAQKAGLDFVVVTDHNNMNGANVYQDMNAPKPPLLVFGNEISTWHDGHLGALGIKETPPNTGETAKIVEFIHNQGGYAVPAHPDSKRKPWTNWNIENFDGLEIYSLSDIFYVDTFRLILKAFFFTPKHFLKSVLKTPEPALKLWDSQLLSGRRIAAFGSIDSHLKFRPLGRHIENLLLHFQAVTMYVLADELDEKKMIDALGHGRSFIAFEMRGIAQDFSFTAETNGESAGMGESVSAESAVRLMVKSPQEGTIRLIHNGRTIRETEGTALTYESSEPGFYRVEIDRGGEIWIISNPIYVTPQESS
ncbi:MAG: PHP domain-containing protein [Candidatus Omnitrophica bacterium]|nr:PHP domain-containing protein [Candidatus Omnitrophota bacterium]